MRSREGGGTTGWTGVDVPRLTHVFGAALSYGHVVTQTLIVPLGEKCGEEWDRTRILHLMMVAGPGGWSAGHRYGMHAVERLPTGVDEYLYLLPHDPRSGTLPPAEIAVLARDAEAQIDNFGSATGSAMGVSALVTRALEDLMGYFTQVTRQMAINSMTAGTLRLLDTPEAALQFGSEIWQWCEGQDSSAEAAPEAFQLAVHTGGAASRDTVAGRLQRSCATFAAHLDEARTASTAELTKLRAALGG